LLLRGGELVAVEGLLKGFQKRVNQSGLILNAKGALEEVLDYQFYA